MYDTLLKLLYDGTKEERTQFLKDIKGQIDFIKAEGDARKGEVEVFEALIVFLEC